MGTEHQHRHRTALVTGAGSGIGREVAMALASQDGAKIYVADRDVAAAECVVGEITATGATAQALIVDLSDIGALQRCLRDWDMSLGAPDIVVNNAGLAATMPALDYPLDHWNKTHAVNVTAPMLLIQHALPWMRSQGWGRVVNIASISGVRAGTGRLAYGTSKAALIALTRQFAIEVAEWGITVNAVAPGPVDTPLVRRLHGSSVRDAYAAMVPMNRYGLPEEVSNTVRFLASDASSYVTGHTLAVDGGYLASGVFDRNLFDKPPTEGTPAARSH